MKRDFLPTAVMPLPAISFDDDIDVAIIKFMMSQKGYTTSEIHYQLKELVHDPDAIKPTMFMLNTNGWFDQRGALYGEPVFVLRKGKTYETLEAEERRTTKVRKFKAPESRIIDPKSVISHADGLDTVIWKLMQDCQYRTAKEIIAMVREYGFEYDIVNRRLQALIHSNRWFDRNPTRGGSNGMTYRLKPKFPCPVRPTLDTVKEEVKATFDAEYVETTETTPVEVPPVEETPKVKAPAFEESDTLHTCIWKVMADMEEYSVNDIALLLTDRGFTHAQISPAMSYLYTKQLMDRREAPRTSKHARNSYVYRLREGVPMFQTGARGVNKPIEQVKQEIQQLSQQLAAQQPAQQEIEMSEPLLKAVTPVAQPAVELLEVTVKMKGVEITPHEFSQLYRELRAQGFHQEAKSSAGLIEASYTVKGISFTDTELRTLVKRMYETGSQFRNVVN